MFFNLVLLILYSVIKQNKKEKKTKNKLNYHDKWKIWANIVVGNAELNIYNVVLSLPISFISNFAC